MPRGHFHLPFCMLQYIYSSRTTSFDVAETSTYNHLPVCKVYYLVDNSLDLLTTPPGFSEGLDFQALSGVKRDEAATVTDVSSSPQTVSISELLSAGDMVLDWSGKENEGVEDDEKDPGSEGRDEAQVGL